MKGASLIEVEHGREMVDVDVIDTTMKNRCDSESGNS
jgi:hypothetical protein